MKVVWDAITKNEKKPMMCSMGPWHIQASPYVTYIQQLGQHWCILCTMQNYLEVFAHISLIITDSWCRYYISLWMYWRDCWYVIHYRCNLSAVTASDILDSLTIKVRRLFMKQKTLWQTLRYHSDTRLPTSAFPQIAQEVNAYVAIQNSVANPI